MSPQSLGNQTRLRLVMGYFGGLTFYFSVKMLGEITNHLVSRGENEPSSTAKK
jgi:hypothetical protein